MKHSLFLLVAHQISQIYEPLGDTDMVLEGLERGVRHCDQLCEMLQEEDLTLYLQWLAQMRQPELVTGMKRLAHLHKGRLMMLEIVSEQDTSKHPAMWMNMRAMFMTEVATQRFRISPVAGNNQCH